MLIPLDHDLIVNTGAIRSITAVPATSNGGERVQIVFTDGARRTINRRIEEMEWCAGPIIPAPPGYQVIRAFEPDELEGDTTFAMYPVIAFRLTADEPMPIIPFGKLGDRWALVWPDGRCDEQWHRLWPTVEAFKASLSRTGARS